MPDAPKTICCSPGSGPERLPLRVFADARRASQQVAFEIAELIRSAASRGERCVLGLATGSTPLGVYDALVELHRDEGLSFANVTTFNLDEYWPMRPGDRQSYRRFMQENLFDRVDLDPAETHLPDGLVSREEVPAACRAYEAAIEKAGGIDLQLLGIGRTGHVGFNEPGSARDSLTRMITLDKVTRMDAASDFFGEWNVPRQAITMGVGSIMNARRVLLLAFGENKAPIVRRSVEEDVTPTVAASYLQEHPRAEFVLDPAGAAELTRFKTPWRLGSVDRFGLEWDEELTRRAAIWLALRLKKPLTRLTDEEYNENGLQELLSERGGCYAINRDVFKQMQKTITGWPGGKPGRPMFIPGRGVSSDNPPDVYPKRIVVFSPHPDDDVISMGGTLQRLCDQGHEVHVAYQTSGNIAVFDDDALRHLDFVRQVANAFDAFSEAEAVKIGSAVESWIAAKTPGAADSADLRRVKGLIRRTEAMAAARYSGVQEEHIHFLDLPFYETGLVRKAPLGDEDVSRIAKVLRDVAPHEIYAAGDLSDPHGTHRVCLAGVYRALDACATESWHTALRVWLYRGAWQEWAPHEIDMAVPLSPSEVDRKRIAIYKHESQKDRALFPGPWDTREFWQRAEDRNRRTAELYDQLGLPEYQAIEGFVLDSRGDGALREQ